MNYKRVHGVIVPIVTPLDAEGHLKHEAVLPLVDYLIERGIQGVFPLGTTGEGPLFSTEERKAFAQTVVQAVHGRIAVIIHTGAITTAETIDLTRHAHTVGADAVAIIPPWYHKLTAEGLLRHIRTVARAVPDMPIYLYENPGVTPNRFTLSMVAELAESEPNVVGMKDSSGSLETLFAARNYKDRQFNTASGPDKLAMAALTMGIDACVSGTANAVPELVVGVYSAVQAQDLETARSLQAALINVCNLLGDGSDLSMYKGLLALRGIDVGQVRLPLVPSAAEKIAANWEIIRNTYLPAGLLR